MPTSNANIQSEFDVLHFQVSAGYSDGSLAILGSFGESFLGFSEEARTRGFPPLPFDRFGFVVTFCIFLIHRIGGNILIFDLITNIISTNSSSQTSPLGRKQS